jgi:hypothetical protein
MGVKHESEQNAAVCEGAQEYSSNLAHTQNDASPGG